MQIVINIDDKDYEGLKKKDKFNDMHLNYYEKLIAHGTPLPKGHGRLVDESKIKKCGWNFIDHHAKTDAPTIIEADRSEKDG